MAEFSLSRFDSDTFVVKDDSAAWAICSAFEGQPETPERRAEISCRLLNNLYRGVALDAINGRAPQEWAREMVYRIADEAGCDEDTRSLLERVLVGAPDLDQLVGSGIIEDDYFEN